jgi:hypothetical protein
MMDASNPGEILRTIEFDNGQKINVIRTDPYGFWHLKTDSGQLPDNLKTSQYTTFAEAKKAVTEYAINADRKIIKTDIGTKTVYEAGLQKDDIYNPPKLNTKKVHVQVT